MKTSLAAVCALAALAVFLMSAAPTPVVQAAPADPRLAKAWRFEQGGWTYVHLEGDPATIGFQHGYLLAPATLWQLDTGMCEVAEEDLLAGPVEAKSNRPWWKFWS